MLQRMRDLGLDVLGVDGARQSRDRDRLDILGVDADHLMRLQRGEHLRGRQRAGGAEIGRAIDRDLCRRAGVVDDIADPHHVVGDGHIGAKHRSRDHVVAALRERRHGRGGEQGGCEQKRANDHDQLP